MEENILSPLNKQAVAELSLLKYYRENGVFAPPKEGEHYYGAEQSLRVDMLIHATTTFILDKFKGDPRPVLRLLAEETAHVIRRFL